MPSLQEMNFYHVMTAMAVRWKDNLAIVNIARNLRYIYSEYHRLTNRIANMCCDRLGPRRGDTATLILDNDDFSVSYLVKEPYWERREHRV
jgi:fatty-acyl-CoA synthase